MNLQLTQRKKMKFSIKNFFSKYDQTWGFVTKSGNLRIWSHLLKKYLMENFIFCAVWATQHKTDKILMQCLIQHGDIFFYLRIIKRKCIRIYFTMHTPWSIFETYIILIVETIPTPPNYLSCLRHHSNWHRACGFNNRIKRFHDVLFTCMYIF